MIKVEKLKDKVEVEVSSQWTSDCSGPGHNQMIYYPCFSDCTAHGKNGSRSCYGSCKY